ncbi:TMEM164 domain containing protein [Trichuris trichiura]|uniref:TMEM164 domain containing protein n=1 Tax=Trichuris trichiura TaxID=36087 RepID=A0A077YXI5_TRITR|nr:TMEM164 domain containing protein [Trichuris trichiura]
MRLLTDGIKLNSAATGGPACLAFLSMKQRLVETAVFLTIASVEMYFFYRPFRRMVFNRPNFDAYSGCRLLRYVLVAILSTTFFAELCYKARTESMLFLLNPCHVATVLQLVCLFGDKISTSVLHFVFAIHMYLLSGATLAMLFPVVFTRQQKLFLVIIFFIAARRPLFKTPGEVAIYWMQHVLIIAFPAYLFSLGGVFCSAAYLNVETYFFCVGVIMAYSFGPLQLLALLTQVNLNNILCPAPTDPFAGPFYRVWAVLHQSAFLPLHGKLHAMSINKVLAYFGRSAPLKASENGISR